MICKIVAEIGATHIGDINRAKDLINLAVLAGADYVKFQKRNPHESTPEEMKHKPHPNKKFAYGETYLEHRINLELGIDAHRELKEYCELRNIGYATSVWDISSAHEIINLNPDFIKVPSACNNNKDLLNILFYEYEGDIHLSTGMLRQEEKLDLFNYLMKSSVRDHAKRIVLYHCTSEYPCPFERLYLNEIKTLMEWYEPLKAIGFSNHGFGIAADVAAYMLGARWIERHFIDDRTFRHTDASASLEPDGLRRLCRDLKMVPKALQYKDGMSEEEEEQRRKLKKSHD